MILVKDGMKESLTVMAAPWTGTRFMGLMKGVIPPTRDWTITNIDKAVFSGYAGEQEILNWGLVTISGEFAVIAADELTWTHDGGPASCSITGLYVVDGNGKLQWVESVPEPYQIMAGATDVVRVTPGFSLGSRFPYP